jgi:hypothetical protein
MKKADRERVERRLAAILAADVAGYSRLRATTAPSPRSRRYAANWAIPKVP